MTPQGVVSWRRHGPPVLLFALMAFFALWRLCALGELPYDVAYQDRFRPWVRSAPPPPPEAPVVRALRAHDRSQLEPYRRYWASYLAGDQVATGWPDWLEVRRQVREGHLPLWRPHVMTGVPLSIGNAASPWSPLTWPGFLLPLRGRGWLLWSHLTLCAVAFYALLLRRGRSREAATAGAAAYAFNPLFIVWLSFGDTVPIFAALPCALIALHAMRDGGSMLRPAAALAAFTALQFLSGNPQFAGYALVIQCAYALGLFWRSERRLGAAVWIAVATVVGLLGASVHLIPFAELASLAERPPGRYQQTNFLPLGTMLSLLFPRLYGHPAHGDFVGGYLFFRSFFYLPGPGVSSFVAALALCGAAQPRQRALALLTAAVPVALVALSSETLHRAVVALLPFFDSLDAPRTIVAFYLGVGLLVAEGFDALDAPGSRKALAALLGTQVAIVVALELWARFAPPSMFTVFVRALAPSLLLAPRVVIPLAITGALLWLARRTLADSRRASTLVLAALAVELVLIAAPTIPAAPPERVLRETPGIRALRALDRASPGSRFIGLTERDTFPSYDGDHLPPNTAEALGLDDLRGCARLRPAPIVELLNATGGALSPTIASAENVHLPLFDLLDVGFVLTSHTLPRDRYAPVAPGIWRNRRPIHRAFFTRCARSIPDADARLRALTAEDFNPYAAVITDAPVAMPSPCEADPSPIPLTVRYPDPTRAEVVVDAPTDGFVVLADAWFPGWTLTVDGVPQSVLRVDHALRGAVVPAGRHTLAFAYRPSSLADGAALTALAWALIAAALLRRRPKLSAEQGVAAVAAAALMLYAWRGGFPNDNDALYADVIRSIREGGHWIALQIDGVPFLDKPPLFFWVGAVVTALLGESEFALRLPVIACGVACVWLTARVARRMTGSDDAAWVAGLVLLTAPQFYEYARRVYMEVPVTLAVLASFDLALRQRWRAAGAAAAAGFMLKSVVGLLGFAPLALIEVVRTRRISRELLLAGLIAALLIAPWHVAVLATDASTLLDFTVNLHVRDQMLSAQPWSTGGPLYYVSSTVKNDPLIAAAFVVGLAAAVPALRRRRDPELVALVAAIALQVVLYSVISTKKSFYVLTVYPLIAVLGARAVAPWIAGDARRRLLAALLVLASFLETGTELMVPDLEAQASTYLAPLARHVARHSPRDARLHALDIYLAAPQFYARRPTYYAVTQPEVVQLIGRIPYLRYGRKTVVWDDQILAQGGWVIATLRDGVALARRVPGARIVARTDAYALVHAPRR